MLDPIRNVVKNLYVDMDQLNVLIHQSRQVISSFLLVESLHEFEFVKEFLQCFDVTFMPMV